MVATRQRTSGAPRRSLISIFDEAGVLHAPTPATPLVSAAPAANSAAAAFLENCRRLRRELFDASVAKYVLRKVVNDKGLKFRGTEVRAGDLWARLVTELRLAFVNEDSSFSSLFDLADATLPVRSEANGLLFSALANLVNPDSPAGDWLDSSGTHFPDDGKRALLKVIRRLYDNGPPMNSAKELLSITFKAGEDPSDGIAAFNSALRESGRKTRWDAGEVKDLFLAALDKEYYLPVLNEFIHHEQRQAVDLLTLQQRVMAVHSAKGTASPPVALSYSGQSADADSRMADVLDALDALRREIRQLKQGHGFTPRSEKRESASDGGQQHRRPSRGGQHSWRRGIADDHPVDIPGANYSQSTKLQYEKDKKRFVPVCKHPKCRHTAERHYRACGNLSVTR
ncbi:hypothetical protein CYMTET_9739 [Cymbomonas tetramitiformis]|uniref:Uncharacterized protein n=1 Tax=Cymbomonas tetramitiformis TaxID=36881 RepID=A0AAE0GQW9_9CHLO|nr:hypothetical protein CYMTET_9739 [Cymbomonas tetramitiformis]